MGKSLVMGGCILLHLTHPKCGVKDILLLLLEMLLS
jgi:hypothetical protein